MKWAALAALGLVLGCTTAPPPAPPAPREVPAELLYCPGPVVVPPAPKAPRTVEQVARWGTAIDAALVKSEAARAECSRRLRRLHEFMAGEERE